MPLFIPLLIGAGAAILGGAGLKKGVDGVGAMRDARGIGRRAEALLASRIATLEHARGQLAGDMQRYDAERRAVVGETLPRLFAFLERLDQKTRQRALADLGSVGITEQQFRAFVGQYLELGGTVTGSLRALAAGGGAWGVSSSLVTAFGTASTGAAISGLSGAAAQSAMLAWLGGGSLAAGGWGVAGGTIVLGGIAVAPALLVAGFVFAAQGEKALTRALEYAADVETRVATIDALRVLLEGVQQRVDELRSVVRALDQRVRVLVDELCVLGNGFDPGKRDHNRRFAATMLAAKGLTELIRTPVLGSDDRPNRALEPLLATARGLLSERGAR